MTVKGLTAARQKVLKGVSFLQKKSEDINDYAEKKGKQLGEAAVGFIHKHKLQPHLDKAVKAYACYEKVKKEVAKETPRYM